MRSFVSALCWHLPWPVVFVGVIPNVFSEFLVYNG